MTYFSKKAYLILNVSSGTEPEPCRLANDNDTTAPLKNTKTLTQVALNEKIDNISIRRNFCV